MWSEDERGRVGKMRESAGEGREAVGREKGWGVGMVRVRVALVGESGKVEGVGKSGCKCARRVRAFVSGMREMGRQWR